VLRCNVAQTLLGEDFRGFSCRLAESELLQWFCKLDRLEGVRIPGQSTLQRYRQWLPEVDLRKVIDTLVAAAAEPEEFLKRMNRLCMKMTHARRKKDARRVRKAVLREMKKLSKIIAAHAGRPRERLEQRWQETDLKEGEARQILERIGSVLAQLPAAMRQAHERIIGERQVKNDEKILNVRDNCGVYYLSSEVAGQVMNKAEDAVTRRAEVEIVKFAA
jgi:hypothetical protein